MKNIFLGVYDLLTAVGNKWAFFYKGEERGVSGIRFFADYAWQGPGPRPFGQAVYTEAAADRIRIAGDGTTRIIEKDSFGGMVYVRDGGARFPVFDLDEPDPIYDARLTMILEHMKAHNLQPWISFFDFCTLKTAGDNKYHSPWYCSLQAMGPETPGGVWGDAQWPWMSNFMFRIIGIVNGVGNLAVYEIMNEADALDMPEDFFLRWHQRAVDALLVRRIPLPYIFGSANRCWDQIEKQVGVYSPHGCGDPNKVTAHPNAQGRILSSDGYWGGTGAADAKGRRGMGADQAVAMAEKIKQYDYRGFEIMDRGQFAKNNDSANVDDFDFGPVMAMARAFDYFVPVRVCDMTDLLPSPYCPEVVEVEVLAWKAPTATCAVHKAPVPPDPPIPPTPPDPPEPPNPPTPDTRTCFEKYIKGRKIRDWNIWRFIKCKLGG